MESFIQQVPIWIWPILLWDSIWKLISLWISARNGQMRWFIILAVLNTVGILPIIYIWTHKRK